MSYTIIYKTIFVKKDDNNYIWFSREGCNNDTAGRDDDYFTRIMTKSEIETTINNLLSREKLKEGFEIKVINKYTDLHGYGEHIKRMFERAITAEQFESMYLLRKENFEPTSYYEDGSIKTARITREPISINDIENNSIYIIWRAK